MDDFCPITPFDDEDAADYAKRMQSTVLPQWPTEVLVEWLHRHAGCLHYSHLGYERFRFEKQEWSLDRIPGPEAFLDLTFCDEHDNIEERARNDWLARFMLQQGTWNTPIILLKNSSGQLSFPSGRPLNVPFHLLEGHRRLSFLVALQKRNKALSHHVVWLVSLDYFT